MFSAKHDFTSFVFGMISYHLYLEMAIVWLTAFAFKISIYHSLYFPWKNFFIAVPTFDVHTSCVVIIVIGLFCLKVLFEAVCGLSLWERSYTMFRCCNKKWPFVEDSRYLLVRDLVECRHDGISFSLQARKKSEAAQESQIENRLESVDRLSNHSQNDSSNSAAINIWGMTTDVRKYETL